ncbi:hypothetical protein AAX10_10080 [Moraxella bovoculi]|nr:hypothetical protein AAX10_10080 [Moraxella bovoculi]
MENIITTLKNQFEDTNIITLERVSNLFISILQTDLPKILSKVEKQRLTVCVVPRAKRQDFYQPNQLLFKSSVKQAVSTLNNFDDGTDFILRHTNTRTTHLDRSGYGGDGDLPYPNITKDTCHISNAVNGRDILLIDDLYTESVNIDEDCLQALLDNGANSVYFYSLGRTKAQNIYNDNNMFKLFNNTLKETFLLASQGYHLEQMAQSRGVTQSTIVLNIIDISNILGSDFALPYKPSDEIVYTVKNSVNKIGSDRRLKPIYEDLNGQVSYDEIRLSLLFIDEM